MCVPTLFVTYPGSSPFVSYQQMNRLDMDRVTRSLSERPNTVCKMLLEKNESKQKEAGLAHFETVVTTTYI